MFVKSKALFIKTKAMFDKTTSLFDVFPTVGLIPKLHQ